MVLVKYCFRVTLLGLALHGSQGACDGDRCTGPGWSHGSHEARIESATELAAKQKQAPCQLVCLFPGSPSVHWMMF